MDLRLIRVESTGPLVGWTGARLLFPLLFHSAPISMFKGSPMVIWGVTYPVSLKGRLKRKSFHGRLASHTAERLPLKRPHKYVCMLDYCLE